MRYCSLDKLYPRVSEITKQVLNPFLSCILFVDRFIEKCNNKQAR